MNRLAPEKQKEVLPTKTLYQDRMLTEGMSDETAERDEGSDPRIMADLERIAKLPKDQQQKRPLVSLSCRPFGTRKFDGLDSLVQR
jgi:hypothetical protein